MHRRGRGFGKRPATLRTAVFAVLCLLAVRAPDAGVDREVTTVLIHARLIPMTGEVVLPDRAVEVVAGRIAAVRPSAARAPAPGARVIDCRGAYLLPGIADMHMHLCREWESGDRWQVSPLRLYLANGVTTVRCFGPLDRSGRYALEWRDAVEAGRLTGPAILTCGPQLRGHFAENPERIVMSWNA